MKLTESNHQFYTDKTDCLEKGIEVFPSIYIEGNAVCGKSVAVRMLLEKHRSVQAVWLDMPRELEDVQKLMQRLEEIQEWMRSQETTVWVIFENLPAHLPPRAAEGMVRLIEDLEGGNRAILISREKPAGVFLELLWKRQMERISMENLLFTRDEVRLYLEAQGSELDSDELFELTGGWAGCVDWLTRLGARERCREEASGVKELCEIYETGEFIREVIIKPLSEKERNLLERAALCPWVNEELCRDVWEAEEPAEVLENLTRKGMMLREKERKRWKVVPILECCMGAANRGNKDGLEGALLSVATWYEAYGNISEAARCLEKGQDKRLFYAFLVRQYDRIPFLGMDYSVVMEWQEKSPQCCYLRGMYCYEQQNFEGLAREIQILGRVRAKEFLHYEVLLNLQFANPGTGLQEWMQLLQDSGAACRENRPGNETRNVAGPSGRNDRSGEMHFRLYGVLGNSVTYLCGMRDLTGLFACARREENHFASLWKEYLGEEEWKRYQLARVDYYLETERIEQLRDEDKALLFQKVDAVLGDSWRFALCRLYLLCKYYRLMPDEDVLTLLHNLEKVLLQEENPVCVSVTEAVSCLYSLWYGEREKLSWWLRYAVMDSTVSLDVNNYMMFYCRAKGYVLLNQYDRAQKILKKLLPYLQAYRRHRFVAEVLFQQAMVNLGSNLKGQATRNTIESFLISANSRYVGFYAGYGQKGREVLEVYIEWLRGSTSEGWHRKKKYNYGNVLRMPVEDYMEVILRCAKRESRTNRKFPEEYIEEKLTMMETIILQDIGRGMSNAEICEELSLKMPTVKGHIYSLFKKLGVNSRVQAILKGKEMGVLE